MNKDSNTLTSYVQIIILQFSPQQMDKDFNSLTSNELKSHVLDKLFHVKQFVYMSAFA